MNIVTLDEIKLQLNIETTNTDYDQLLTDIGNSVESFVEKYTNTFFYTRDIKGVAGKEIPDEYPDAFLNALYVPYKPINSVSVLGYDIDLTTGKYNEVYNARDIIWSSDGLFVNTSGYFVYPLLYIKFNCGYDKPEDIKQTILDSVRLKFKHTTENADLIDSKNAGGETMTYNLGDFSDTGKMVLKMYKDRARPITIEPNKFLEVELTQA